MNTPFDDASAATQSAGLPAKTERNALRLLACVHPDNGLAVITWTALAALWECSEAVARRHLGIIKSAGIIHYSSNQDVYIYFYAWESSKISTFSVENFDEIRAWARDESPGEDEPGRVDETDCPQNGRKTRVGARISSTFSTDIARPRAFGGDNRGGRLVGSSLIPTPGEKTLPTNQPVSVPGKTSELEPWEAALSEGLLLALGCENLPAIREIAATTPFQEVRAHALAWQRDTRAQGPGALLHRIRSADFATPDLSAEDRRSALFHRWPTPAEKAAHQEAEAQAAAENAAWEERRRQTQAQPERPPQAATPPPPAPDAPDESIWEQILADLRATLPAATLANGLLTGATATLANGLLTVHTTNVSQRDFLQARLARQIARSASRLAGRAIDTQFV